MRVLLALAIVGLLPACGEGRHAGPAWLLELHDAQGRPVTISDHLVVVRFAPASEPRQVLSGRVLDPRTTTLRLAPLSAGHYEIWLPGYRPLRVDRAPDGPLPLELGHAIDVAWREDAPLAEGRAVQVQATWRGPGDHPEALLRAQFPAAAPPPGERSRNWVDFVKGILLEPPAREGRLHVPWPGRYRLEWGVASFRIREAPGSFSGSGGSSRSPDDAIAVDVPEGGGVPRVEIPRR